MKTISKTIKTTTSISISHKDLLCLIREQYPGVPTDAKVFVRVPGGADWSNTDLDIDDGCPLHVVYTEVTEEKE